MHYITEMSFKHAMYCASQFKNFSNLNITKMLVKEKHCLQLSQKFKHWCFLSNTQKETTTPS